MLSRVRGNRLRISLKDGVEPGKLFLEDEVVVVVEVKLEALVEAVEVTVLVLEALESSFILVCIKPSRPEEAVVELAVPLVVVFDIS
jgi:hypothetical protein